MPFCVTLGSLRRSPFLPLPAGSRPSSLFGRVVASAGDARARGQGSALPRERAATEQRHLPHRFAMRILSTLGRRYPDLCRTVRNQEPWCSVSPSLTCPAAANRSDWPAGKFQRVSRKLTPAARLFSSTSSQEAMVGLCSRSASGSSNHRPHEYQSLTNSP
jgi:hypothetical protein